MADKKFVSPKLGPEYIRPDGSKDWGQYYVDHGIAVEGVCIDPKTGERTDAGFWADFDIPDIDPPHIAALRQKLSSPAKALLNREIPTEKLLRATESVEITEATHSYASVQISLPEPYRSAMLAWTQENVLPADILELEENPHVTVRYGFNDVPLKQLQYLVGGFKEARFWMARPSLFYAGEKEVLCVALHSADLHRLYTALEVFPHVNTHDEFHPHVTLAYLKPGSGWQYVGRPISGVSGMEVVVTEVELSNQDGEVDKVTLL